MKKSFRLGVIVALAVLIVGTTAAWGWGPRGGQSDKGPGGLVTAVAEAVGMSVADVRAEIHSGKTFSEILAENGVDAATVIAQTLDWMEARLLQAVDDGRITEELAAERLASAEARIIDRLEQSAPLGPMWGSGQARGHHGRAFGGSTRGFGNGHGPGSGTCIFPEAPATTS